jgi:hypothetical protein
MPLSENEQRLLEQIERALVEDDPKFANTVRSTNQRTYLIRRVRRNTALFVAGLAMLIVGVVLNRLPALTITLGIAGFAIMLAAALRIVTDVRRASGRSEQHRRGGAPRRRNRATFMERVEERWRRRWEN